MSARQLVSKVSPKGWAVIGCAIAATVMFVYFVFHLAGQPSYATLMTGLDPAQTGKLTSTLDTKGIAYQIQNGGTALAVESDKTAQARIALASSGLLTSSQPGFSLFDHTQLGASNFQQQVTYQRALEGQLAQTIDSIQGVSSAQVQLVLPNPQDQLFTDNSTPATAAVLLSGTTSLDPGSVKGIARLVASSVQGLTPDHVTITDSSGQLLWPTADAIGSADGSFSSKQSAEARYDATTAAQVGAMLAQTLGPGKAQVVVNADLNADQATQDTLQYAKGGVPLNQHIETETLVGNGTRGAGAAGTTSNIPAYAQTGATGNSNYRNSIADTQFGVNKTITHAVIAPGKVNRQTVSVLIDSSVPASEMPAIQNAVSDAVGLDATRGDKLSISQVAFAKPKISGPLGGSVIAKYMKYAKLGAAALGSILFLLFISRYLRRREREAFAGEPMWLRELESPRPLKALELGEPQEETRVMQLRSPVNVAKVQLEDLVERDPDRVAHQVRAWMAED